MQSHTVPRKLLEQFAYDDPVTRSNRLWRYEKGRPPYRKASPRTATRIDGHFSDPENVAKEAELEARLNREFEEPVNSFLFEIADASFVPTDIRRRQLTSYVTLLFNRSEARRKASNHLQDVFKHALDLFLKNESQLNSVAIKWNLDAYFSGRLGSRLATKDDVIKLTKSCAIEWAQAAKAQTSYLWMIEDAMSNIDQKVLAEKWSYLRTIPSEVVPVVRTVFVLS